MKKGTHMNGMVFKNNDKPVVNMNKTLSELRGDGGKRAGSSPFQDHNDKHEGNETMGGEQLSKLTGKTYPGGTDYYINRDKDNKPIVLGEVDLEGGDVTGVPGSKGGKLTRKSDKKPK